MRKILVALCFISIMIGGCSSQTNKKNTESDSTKNTVKENIFVNISDSKTHFPLYVGGASSSVEIDIPITKEIEKKVLENNKYETQYYIDFKLNDSDDKQILSVKGISWNIGDENPVIMMYQLNKLKILKKIYKTRLFVLQSVFTQMIIIQECGSHLLF